MRVPWYIILIGILVTVMGTWYAGTREYDFMTPKGVNLPPEDFGEDLAAGIPRLSAVQFPPAQPPPVLPDEIKQDQITSEDLGNPIHAPGLDEYRDFTKRKGALRTLELSSRLQASSQSQRALLALERIIDSTTATPDEMAQAVAGINALKKSLPKWHLDTSREIPLTLHLTSAQKAPNSLKKAVLSVATRIRESSDLLLNVTPKVSSSNSETPSESVTLQLIVSTKDQEDSPVLTLNSLFKENSNPTDELAKVVFRMIRLHLTDLGYPMPDSASPRDLNEGITRLMWRDYAHSLLPESKKLPSTIPEAEKDETEVELR